MSSIFDRIVNRENTASIKYDWREKLFQHKDVIPLWVADMDFETPSFIREAVKQRADHPVYGYSFRTDQYNEAVIDWVSKRHGYSLDDEWLVFSPGIVPALNFAVASLTQPGDGVLVQPPVYHPFFSAVKDHARKLLMNELLLEEGEYRVNWDDFEAKAKEARLFLLSSPHNPVGKLWTAEELMRMAEICIRHDVIIISDEIHNDLILPGFHHTMMASLSERIAQQTITCIAPSKTFNMAGLATSTVVISNPELRKSFVTFMEHMHLFMGNLFGAVAAEAGYRNGAAWVDDLMIYVDGNLQHLTEILHEYTDIRVIAPQATYMAWLDFRATRLDDAVVRERLIHDAGLGLSPGSQFGPGGEGFQRINLAAPYQTIHTAVMRLKETFGRK